MGRIADLAVQLGIAEVEDSSEAELSGWDKLDGMKEKG